MTSKQNNRKGLKCHFCGKQGHFKRDCFNYIKSLKDNEFKSDGKFKKGPAQQKACAAEEQSEDEVIGLYVKQTTPETATDWIIDSGASCHMSYDKTLFNEIEQLDEPQEITVGDEFDEVKATGRHVNEGFESYSI